jgi:uncharacterized membrane protein
MATNIDRKFRLKLSAQNWLFVILLLVLAGLVSFVAREYKKEWDVSLNARNTLTQPTIDMLKQLTEPVTITSYCFGQRTSCMAQRRKPPAPAMPSPRPPTRRGTR